MHGNTTTVDDEYKLHSSNDEPAVTWVDGGKEWYQHGQRHRDNDQPAVIDADGNEEWWEYGERHRARSQPAVIHNKYRIPPSYYFRGKPHSLLGPYYLRLHPTFFGTAGWWLHGQRYMDD